ncbi:hypothetical protein ANRL3_00050 [Anaerolineae bacterium]|nr:hypothetical protein ANRL3_00050 [Anaerolineae bacterium]
MKAIDQAHWNASPGASPAQEPGKVPYPFNWPAGKPAREQRPAKKGGRRKRAGGWGVGAGLTQPGGKRQNGTAFDASEAGRENPIYSRRTKRQPGAFFTPGIPPWRLGRGMVRPWPVPRVRFLTPVQAATISGVRTGVAAPFIFLGANP